MSPPIPTDPTLIVPTIDRSSFGTPAVLAGYALLALLLLARGVKHSWLGGRGHDASEADDSGPETDREGEEPLAERREEAPS